LGIAMAGGALIILNQVFAGGLQTSRIWLHGFLIILLSRLVLLWIPYIRGYLNWDGDNISHSGMISDVVETGYLYGENAYPAAHIIAAQVVSVTGLPSGTVASLSTGLMSVFYIVAILLLSREVLPGPKQQLVALLLAGFIVVLGGYNVFFMPNGWSILFLPIFFLLYFKRVNKRAYTIPFLIVLVLYPFFHPLSSLMIVFALLFVMMAGGFILKWFKMKRHIHPASFEKDKPGRPLLPAVLLLVILLPWILSFEGFKSNIISIWSQVTSGGPGVLNDISSTLEKIETSTWESILLYFKLYGVASFFILLSVAGLILLVKRMHAGKSYLSSAPLLSMGILPLFFGFLYLLYLLDFPGMSSIGAPRMISYLQVFAPVIGGYALFEAARVLGRKRFSMVLTTLVLLCVSILGIRSLYPSPYVLKPNAQITRMSIEGAKWFIKEKDTLYKTGCIISPMHRFADGILGKSAASSRLDLQKRNIFYLEDRFGYGGSALLGGQYNTKMYFNITVKDRIIYHTVWDSVARFKLEDFKKLESDKSVKKIYQNNEFGTYKVAPVS